MCLLEIKVKYKLFLFYVYRVDYYFCLVLDNEFGGMAIGGLEKINTVCKG